MNGPKLAARDNVVSLAWFTAANDRPEVKVAFSKDGGLNFEPPIRIDEGLPMGRVDAVLLDKNTALISWMESVGDQARIRLALVDRSSGKIASREVAEVSGSRSTGFPQLEKFKGQIFMAWNDGEGKKKKIKVIGLDLEGIYP